MAVQRILTHNYPSLPFKRLSSIRPFTSDTYKSDDYQYLQKGQIPMLYFQRSLPRLKIPELKQSCDRLLAAVKPIITDPTEYDNFAKSVELFQTTGSGPKLQALLQAYDAANNHTSYISQPWFDMYLSDRKPLPLNYNPSLIMKLDVKPEYNEQLTRTTNLIVSSLRFMRSLREESLEPEVFHLNAQKSDTPRYRWVMNKSPIMFATFVSYAFKAFPLDMSQVGVVFGGIITVKLFNNNFVSFSFSIKVCSGRLGFHKKRKIRSKERRNHRIFVFCVTVISMLSTFWIAKVMIYFSKNS